MMPVALKVHNDKRREIIGGPEAEAVRCGTPREGWNTSLPYGRGFGGLFRRCLSPRRQRAESPHCEVHSAPRPPHRAFKVTGDAPLLLFRAFIYNSRFCSLGLFINRKQADNSNKLLVAPLPS